MRLKPASLLLFSFLMVTSPATAEPVNRNFFTLQVASFQDLKTAEEFATRLTHSGLQAVCRTVELRGQGIWNRVLVGSFKTFGEAHSHGDSLVARGLIQEFLVKLTNDSEGEGSRQVLTIGQSANNGSGRETFASAVSYAQVYRPGAAAPSGDVAGVGGDARDQRRLGAEAESQPGWASERRANEASSLNQVSRGYVPVGHLLPKAESRGRWLSPTSNPASAPALIPRPDPVRVALGIVGGKGLSDISSRKGGLWLSGDTGEGLARLRWIVGNENSELIGIDSDGRVALDLALLARVARVERGGAATTTIVVDYLLSNEGLLLLVELTQGANRYQLHLGSTAPTAGGAVRVAGSINLDNNFDSRINPYRRLQRKLDSERPPEGFEALIAINPHARWFNLPASRFVPVGHITFHELAEAYAKVQLGLDYLVQEPYAGAHNLAIERERILKLQRPLSDVVVTAGSNRMLRLGDEMRRFYSESRRSISGFR